MMMGAYKNAHGTCPTAVWLARQCGARGVTPLLAQIQLNIQFINPWAVNSNTRGDELALVTPFDRGIPAVDVINPTPHGISMPRGSPRLKRGSLLLHF